VIAPKLLVAAAVLQIEPGVDDPQDAGLPLPGFWKRGVLVKPNMFA